MPKIDCFPLLVSSFQEKAAQFNEPVEFVQITHHRLGSNPSRPQIDFFWRGKLLPVIPTFEIP